jgi:hypothetical protein
MRKGSRSGLIASARFISSVNGCVSAAAAPIVALAAVAYKRGWTAFRSMT